PQRAGGLAQLLLHQDLLEQIEPLTSVLHSVVDRVQPEVEDRLSDQGEALLRQTPPLLALQLVGQQVQVGELAGPTLQLDVPRGQREIHDASSWSMTPRRGADDASPTILGTTRASTATHPADPAIRGFTSSAWICSPRSWASSDNRVRARATAATSARGPPFVPSSRRRTARPSMSRMARGRSSGGRANRRSPSTSMRAPPAATITMGPNWSSRTTPRASSTPGPAISATVTSGPSRRLRSR